MTAFIWDLDGTLLDSYPAILAGLEETYEQFDLPFDRDAVRSFILRHSVKDLLVEVAEKHGLDAAELEAVRALSLREKNTQLTLMEGAREVLEWTVQQGIQNFVYTHKSNNAFAVLEDLGILPYFTEVLTSQSGFARKPDPEALNYLMAKYGLDQADSYYIGDRLLDTQTALAAGIGSFNLIETGLDGDQHIKTLWDVPKMFHS